MVAQSTAEASKNEACFHVESQRIAEGTIPYQPISCWGSVVGLIVNFPPSKLAFLQFFENNPRGNQKEFTRKS
jgi:hypothetical protein